MSRRVLLMRELWSGPMTTAQMATATGIPMRGCSLVMHKLWKAGRVIRAQERVIPKSGLGAGHYVYSLKGQAMRGDVVMLQFNDEVAA